MEHPPSKAQLERVLARLPLKALFNTSGQSYRDGNYKERLATMTQAEALTALASDGKLIKRPLVLGTDVEARAVSGSEPRKDVALTGFDESAWSAALT